MNNEQYDFAKLQSKLDYYKHEYFSECDRSEKLEKALDKACERMASMCNVIEVCDELHCPLNPNRCGLNCDTECESSKSWKEWCLKNDN